MQIEINSAATPNIILTDKANRQLKFTFDTREECRLQFDNNIERLYCGSAQKADDTKLGVTK
jgi:hypothetical protein